MTILPIIYLLFVLGFILFSIFGLYHLWKFGFRGDLCKIVMATYVIVSGIIVFFSLVIILSLDWGTAATFPNLEDFIPSFFKG